MQQEIPSQPKRSAGIYLLHKPVGPTSFVMVRDFAGTDEQKPRLKICHGGVLDPFAHGLLLILTGSATRLFDHLHAIPKIYEGTIRWGTETDNGDPLGKVLATGNPSTLTPEQLDEVLPPFQGWHDQIPPATSNKRIAGERAYQKAHRGEEVVLPPARVYLHEAQWLSHDLPHQSRLRIVARGGYYVRALVRDIGRSVGCGAHLSELHRLSIGPWNDPGPDNTVKLATDDLLPWASTRILKDQEVGDLRKKSQIPIGDLIPPAWPLPPKFPEPSSPVRGMHQGRLHFLLRHDGDQLKLISAFPGGLGA